MAPPKKSRKPRATSPKNQYSAELTSGQLVMGITILMVFGLACFLVVNDHARTRGQAKPQPVWMTQMSSPTSASQQLPWPMSYFSC